MEQNADEPTDVAVPRAPWDPASSTSDEVPAASPTDEEPVVDDTPSLNPTDHFPIPKRPKGVMTSDDRPPPAVAAVAPDDAYLEAGTMLGDYRIEAQIGEGGMGVVYAAVHPLIGKRAAVKVLKAELCRSAFNVERFVDEARIVNQIGHPNIVDVFAFGQTRDGRSYFVMEWLKGESLRARIARSRLDLTEVCEVIRPLARALEAAHEQGVIHRDLKPDNIFLVDVRGDAPLVKLLDFGIAKLAREEHRMERTATGAMVGTPQYIAPEQAKGYAIDHRVDIYSLGGIVFELLTGQPPFVADNAMEMVAKHLMEPPARPSAHADVPALLDDLVIRMLSKDPAGRPTLAEIAAVIERTSALDRTNVKTPVPRAVSHVASEPIGVPTPTPPSSPNLRGAPGLERPASSGRPGSDPAPLVGARSATVDAPRTPSKKLVGLLGIGFVIAAVGGYFVVSALKSESVQVRGAEGDTGASATGETAPPTAEPNLEPPTPNVQAPTVEAKVEPPEPIAPNTEPPTANAPPIETKVDAKPDRPAAKIDRPAARTDRPAKPAPKTDRRDKPVNAKSDGKLEATKPPAKLKPGRLELAISGGKPKIVIDGVASGAVKELAPGAHNVQVSSPGFKTQSFTITIHEGATQTKTIKLVPDDSLMTPGSLGGN